MASAYDFEQPSEFGRRASQPSITGVPMQTTPLQSSFARPRSGFAPGAPAPGSFPNAGGTEPGGTFPRVPQPPAGPTPGAPTKPGEGGTLPWFVKQPPPLWAAGSGQLEGFGGMRADGSAKLGSDHALKSPKYAFGNVFSNYANTRDGFEAGFSDLQRQYPQFFGNWQIQGDDSIVWNGTGQLHDAFQGHSGFDVWRNASGEDGGPGGWQWGSHQDSGAAQTSDPTINALLQAFAAPGMQAPAPSFDMNAILQLMNAMQPPPGEARVLDTPAAPAPDALPPPTFYGQVAPSVLNFGDEGLPKALRMLTQRAPYMVPQQAGTENDLLAQIRRLVGA